MTDTSSNKTKRVTIRLSQEQYSLLESRWKKTTTRKLADYLRRCLFDKPIVTTYRNKSLDDFMSEMMLLRRELNALSVNFNQAVKRLNTFFATEQAKTWLKEWESGRTVLLSKVEEIKVRIGKIADQWLQK